MLKEFKEFVVRGNVVDMATGIIVGAAFGTVVKSLVEDLLMPPIGLLLGGVDFANLFLTLRAGDVAAPATLAEAREAGAVTINYGIFLGNVVSLLIVAAAVFLLVRGVNAMRRKEETAPAAPSTRECPHCATAIPIKASRCPHCTSELRAAPAG